MNIFTRERNPKIKRLFDDDHIHEMEQEVKLNVDAMREGRREDFLFLQSLRGNWSVEQLVNVAQQRGKSWRFISAMADKANEMQGVTMLYFVAESTQFAFRESTLEKSLLSLERMRAFTANHIRRTGTEEDPITLQLLSDAEVEVISQSREARARLNRRMQNMIGDD